MVSLSCPQSRLRPRLDLPSNSNTSRSIAHSTSIPQRAQRCTSLAPTIVHRVFEVSGAHTQHTQSTGVESTVAAHSSAPLESTPSASACSTLAARTLSLLSTLTFVLSCLLCFALRCGLSVCPAIDSTRAVGRVDESIERSDLSPQDLNGRQLFDEIRSGKHSDSSDNTRWRSKGFVESIDSRCLSLPLSRRLCVGHVLPPDSYGGFAG